LSRLLYFLLQHFCLSISHSYFPHHGLFIKFLSYTVSCLRLLPRSPVFGSSSYFLSSINRFENFSNTVSGKKLLWCTL
jgi:hypothetical protein